LSAYPIDITNTCVAKKRKKRVELRDDPPDEGGEKCEKVKTGAWALLWSGRSEKKSKKESIRVDISACSLANYWN
jgi:hypothetical protein